ncbi:Syntaxin-like protein psy1 [Escovopsis weberi]|uniref:Syntaxin-like protein psy1 n=1 Tax=Escovopsis weberi TaxID=150374 RepID=A0A0M9VW48_ESCWE|nr:Syntaxin-like protein psy1 [Escovopsis weberi]
MSQDPGKNPYVTGFPAPSPYGQLSPYGSNNPYESNSTSNYELHDLSTSSSAPPLPRPPAALSQGDFLARVQNVRNEIRGLTADVDYIAQLHQRTLGTTDPDASAQLEHYVTQTQIRNTAIKDGIKGLEADLSKTTDASRNTKNTQLQSLRTFFKSELDRYQSIERDYQQRYRDQIARQYRIVNPEATDEEVQLAAEADWSNEGVFQTALRTNRTGHAASLLGNVRARHNELQRIENTLFQLAILYQELAALVEQQEPVIISAEDNAQQTVENIEKGNEQVMQATEHARRRRRLKWWLLLVVVLILIAIGLGVGLGISLTNNHNNNNNNSGR